MKLIFKFAGIAAVMISFSLFGFFKSYSKKAYIRRLNALELAFERAETMLRLGAGNRKKILISAFGNTEGFTMSGGKAEYIDRIMTDKLLSAVNTFLREFGSGDALLEQQRIKRAQHTVRSALEEEKKAYAASYKIWQTAGVCTGLCLGIIFI